jgi:hypothetical protein
LRVSLINLNLTDQDIISQSLLNQARFFQEQGSEVQIYLMDPPQSIPEDMASLIRVSKLADLISGRDLHFIHSDLYIYHYPNRYPLIESMKGIDRGVVIFYYHHLASSEVAENPPNRPQADVGELIPYADLIIAESPLAAVQLTEKYACDPDRLRILDNLISQDVPGKPSPDERAQLGASPLESYEVAWGKIVAEVKAWLPEQSYPRSRSLLAGPVVAQTGTGGRKPSLTVQEVISAGEPGSLEAAADVMLHDYVVHSKLPLIGPLIDWLRHNLTSHLREPYLDPTLERQVAFNRKLAATLRDLSRSQADLKARLVRLEQNCHCDE